MQLLPDDGSLCPKVIAGSIEALATTFYQKLQMFRWRIWLLKPFLEQN